MGLFSFIRDIREGFVDGDIGDRLVSIESKLIGIIGFFVSLIHFDFGLGKSAFIALMLCVLIPCLVGLVEIFAIIFSIAFSTIWAFLGYFVAAMITGSSLAGILVALIVFVLCIFVHKVFAGIGYESILSAFLRR